MLSAEEITLSNLSGDELLQILRQSLAKKKEPFSTPVSDSPPVDDPVDDPLEQTQVSVSLDSNTTADYEIVNPKIIYSEPDLPDVSSEAFLKNVLSCDQDPMEFNPEFTPEFNPEFTPQEPKQDTPPEPSIPSPHFLFLMGKMSSSLATTNLYTDFYSTLQMKLTSAKIDSDQKKQAYLSIKEKTEMAKQQYDRALKHLEIATIAYKDADVESRSLSSICEYILKLREKTNSSVSQDVKEAAQYGGVVPDPWRSIVGAQVYSMLDKSYVNSNEINDGLVVTTFNFDEFEKSGDILDSRKNISSNSSPRNTDLYQDWDSIQPIPHIPQPTSLKRHIDDICNSYNRGDCTSSRCEKSHVCLHCHKSHPVIRCGSDKATERILCVQWNVDERKCSSKCVREHRCLRCCSLNHTINKCNYEGPSKQSIKTYCYLFNASSTNFCSNRDCTRFHCCLRCGKNHGTLNCTDNVKTYIYEEADEALKRQKSSEPVSVSANKREVTSSASSRVAATKADRSRDRDIEVRKRDAGRDVRSRLGGKRT